MTALGHLSVPKTNAEELIAMSSVTEMSRIAIGTGPSEPTSWKSTMDRVFAIILLVVALPVMAVAMLLVRATSRGPVIYRQTRLGLHGRRYTIYKIRTMRHDCERLTGPCWSTPGDKRVTPIGRILRVTHIDELPQLYNILRGEMSLVGPRPERPEIASQLELAIPRYRERLGVRPGVTGLAQVQLPPETTVEEVHRKLACDLYYIRHASAWLDLRIIFATALGVCGIPFFVARELFRIPSGEVISSAYCDSSGEMVVLRGELKPLSQATSA
jgi:lipopolysaccharide/colanic/teichoic acid biosynthesis glycosyltransferase